MTQPLAEAPDAARALAGEAGGFLVRPTVAGATPADLIGLAGVALVVGTYFLSQIGRMDVRRPLYPGLNAVGAVMILVSLRYSFNLASAAIEGFWLAISLVGLAGALRRRVDSPGARRHTSDKQGRAGGGPGQDREREGT